MQFSGQSSYNNFFAIYYIRYRDDGQFFFPLTRKITRLAYVHAFTHKQANTQYIPDAQKKTQTFMNSKYIIINARKGIRYPPPVWCWLSTCWRERGTFFQRNALSLGGCVHQSVGWHWHKKALPQLTRNSHVCVGMIVVCMRLLNEN